MSILLLANLGGIVWADDSKPGAWSITLDRITQIQSPRLDSPKVTTESGTLVLGDDSYELRMPKTTDAYATKTKTLVTLDHTKKEHVSMPMHALVWFYNSETIHRNAFPVNRMEKMIELDSPDFFKPFWQFLTGSAVLTGLTELNFLRANPTANGWQVPLEDGLVDKRKLIEIEYQSACVL